MGGGHIDARLAGDAADRGGLEAPCREQPLRSIDQDATRIRCHCSPLQQSIETYD